MRNYFLASLLVLAGFSAQAQEVEERFKGTNPDQNAPVNVPDAAQRPANPQFRSSTPVKGGQVFRVKDNKPDTSRRPRPAFPAELLPKQTKPANKPE